VRHWRPSYFLFVWPKRKVTKEKGHPAWRLPPIRGRQVREPGPGFSTGLLSWRKGIGILADAPAGLSSPSHRRTGAPGRATRLLRVLFRRASATARATLRFGFSPSAGQDGPLLYPGPLCSGGWMEEQPAGWPARMPASLASGQDALSTNPVTHPRTWRGGSPASG
jgi:hypothetical protein